MSFSTTLLAHRRLTAGLLGVAFTHVLLYLAALAAIIRYQQLWAIAAVIWLPLMIVALRWTTGALKLFFESRNADVLAVNGVSVVPAADDPAGERLANVAEEMAVATGGEQPQAAVGHSQAMNAFMSTAAAPGKQRLTVVFTAALAARFNRNELQAVAAHLYAHQSNFDRMFVAMAGAMYLAVFAAADIFLVLTVLNWNFGASGNFSTGPLVVLFALGLMAGPVVAAKLAQAYVMRRFRFVDDLSTLLITNDPESLIGALKKVSENSSVLEATYDITNVHFYFDAVRDPARKFPWQRRAAHPRLAARIKALRTAIGG